jgi:hypothetical protein
MVQPASRRRLDRFGRGCDCHRRRRHGRRRCLHQPWLSGQGHPLRVLDPVAVDGRRRGRAVRGVFLQRARRDVSALERRIQLPRPGLSPGLRFCGGLGVGDRRLCRARSTRRDGVRGVRQIGSAGCLAAGVGRRCGLAGVAGAAHGRQALQHLPADRDHPQGRADRGLPGRGLRDRRAAAAVVRAVLVRLLPYRQRAVRDQPRVRDVFVLGLECRDLHHRRDARAGA